MLLIKWYSKMGSFEKMDLRSETESVAGRYRSSVVLRGQSLFKHSA